MSEVTNTTCTPIEVLHNHNPENAYLYISTHQAENFTVNQETKEGHFVFQGYWYIMEEKLPTTLEFLLYEGEKTTYYKVEVNKKVKLEDVEEEGFEDDEYPGCRIVLFPEYVFQIFFKVLETNPIVRKTSNEIETKTISLSPSALADGQPLVAQQSPTDDEGDLVSKILRDMNSQSNHESS